MPKSMKPKTDSESRFYLYIAGIALSLPLLLLGGYTVSVLIRNLF